MKLLTFIILIGSFAELRANEISYLAVNSKGEEIYNLLNGKDYERHLVQTFQALDASMEQQFTDIVSSQKKFKLTQIVLGIGATAEVGIGPYKIGAGIKHRVAYKRSL